jgi:methylmalonyl-CoA mutase cobalamin-binding subunit
MRTRAALFKARGALLWERAAPVLVGPLAALGLYLLLAFGGLFERAGDPVRILIFLALALAGGILARRAWNQFKAPTHRDAQRRVEDDSGLTDRPFEALADAPAAGDSALWDAHRQRMEARLATARARRPFAAWARLDPYGLRAGLIILIITAAFLAGDRAFERLGDAFTPRLMAGGGTAAEIEFWIEPPAYTGRPVAYLRDRREAQMIEGSTVAARIVGLRRDPRVTGGEAQIEALSQDVRLVTLVPQSDGEIVIRSGALRESLLLTLVEDSAPQVRLAAEPEGDAQGQMVLDFVAEDDFGIEAYALEFAPEPQSGEPAEDSFETLPLTGGDISPPDADGVRTARIDLARHTLAGERAVIRMAALDGAGQRGVSGPLAVTLPQRVFLDPLARAVASERKRFIGEERSYADMPEGVPQSMAGGFLGDEPARRLERAPEGVLRLAQALDAVSDAPAVYFDDPIVWMGLRTAMREVRRARELEDLNHLDEDLWQIALRAELGSLADAEAALRAAEQALMDAMARGADPIELSALFDAFEQAVANYMQALAREAAEEGRFAQGGGGGDMGSDGLQELLDALRDAAELGDTEGSRRALAQLLELLRNMQVTLSQGGEGEGGESAMAEALREALEDLGETLSDQREAMNDTFEEAERQSRSDQGQSIDQPGDAEQGEGLPAPGSRPGEGFGEPDEAGEPGGFGAEAGEEPGAGLDELADRQAAIAEAIPGLSERLPNAGPSAEAARRALDEAGEAMDEAAAALERGNAEAALNAQDAAIEALRDAAQSASQALEAARGGDQEGDTDPLGRAQGGQAGAGTQTGIPGEADRQRAREILEELRRRAAERGRPQEELDYIDRLLERF